MNPWFFMRLANIARHPPSRKRIYLMLTVAAIVLLIVGIENIFGWPEALTVNGKGGRLLR